MIVSLPAKCLHMDLKNLSVFGNCMRLGNPNGRIIKMACYAGWQNQKILKDG